MAYYIITGKNINLENKKYVINKTINFRTFKLLLIEEQREMGEKDPLFIRTSSKLILTMNFCSCLLTESID